MRFVIIGNGVAGINAARSISSAGVPGAEIEIYTDERYPYYPRPRLPDFLAGEISMEDLILYSDDWYEQRGIRVHLGQAVAKIEPAERRIILADGTAVGYDRLLLANGSRPFVPPIQGTERAGVFTLRTLADAREIQEYARRVDQAIVIGGGVLGLEAGRGLAKLGPRVTIVEFFPRLMPRQLDAPGAKVLQRQIEALGIQIVLDAATEAILGDGRPTGIRLKDGREFAGQMILISAGIRSNVGLAQEAGIQTNRAVVVDRAMRTNAPDVWAAGDVAEFEGRTWGIVTAATEQARVAAANMAAAPGETPATYTEIVPSNTLKVVGIDLTSIGVVNPEGDGYLEKRRIDEEAGLYEKVVVRDGRIVGAILLGERTKLRSLTELITKKVDVSAHVDDLLEEDFDLATLL